MSVKNKPLSLQQIKELITTKNFTDMKRVFKNLDVCELIGFAVLGILGTTAFACCVINSIVTL